MFNRQQEGSKGLWGSVCGCLWMIPILQTWKESVFPLEGLLPVSTVGKRGPPPGCPNPDPSHFTNRRLALGGRDVSAERRSCGCSPSHPGCQTWQREGPEHPENRWVSGSRQLCCGGGPQTPSGLGLWNVSAEVFFLLTERKRELHSRYLAHCLFKQIF